MQWQSTSKTDLQLCLRRDAERMQVWGNNQNVIKWLSRLLSLVFSVLHTSLPNASGSKEWKAMKKCSGRTKKSQHLQKASALSCAPLHSHRWGRLHGWTWEQLPGRAGKRDLGKKEGSCHRKKAQLNYPHPCSNFCCQLWPENHPLAARFMSCEVGLPE